jgi:hypothetical protein
MAETDFYKILRADKDDDADRCGHGGGALGVNGPVLDRHRYTVIVLATRTIVLSLYSFDS